MIDPIDILRIILVICGTSIGAWYDIFRKKNVPEVFLYSFLGFSIAMNLFAPTAFLETLPIAVLLLALLYVFYKVGYIGGADVIILAAIYAGLPILNEPLFLKPSLLLLPLAAPRFPSIFSILSIAAFIFFVAIIIKYIPFIAKRIITKKLRFSLSNIVQCIIIILIYSTTLYLLTSSPLFIFLSPIYLIFISLVMVFVCFFILFKDVITESMIKWKTNVEEEDVIALEKIDEKTIKKLRLQRLVTKEQLDRMKQLKGRKWPVLDLPAFLPYILIALLIYILIGDPLFYLV